MLPALHHLSLGVRDRERSARVYDAALAALGFVRVWSDIRPGQPGQAIGYGHPGRDDVLALKHRPGADVTTGAGFHVALAATSRAAVDAFHAAALTHGGADDGAPGLRPAYGEHYYAAFVRDPDGHRLEAVFEGVYPASPDGCRGASMPADLPVATARQFTQTLRPLRPRA